MDISSLLYRWLTSDRLSTTISGDHPSRRRRKVDNLNKVNVGLDLSENSHVWIPFTHSVTEICLGLPSIQQTRPAQRTSFRYAEALFGYIVNGENPEQLPGNGNFLLGQSTWEKKLFFDLSKLLGDKM